jgi:DNA-binding cell septation regulator SpoVG
MKIKVEWMGDGKQFNVSLASGEGKQEFLSIKGVRIVQGTDGEFVGWPATKNENTQKWWRHVWASDAFASAVIDEARKTKPQRDTRTQGERNRGPRADDDSVPF